jgi:hypothetical protein
VSHSKPLIFGEEEPINGPDAAPAAGSAGARDEVRA